MRNMKYLRGFIILFLIGFIFLIGSLYFKTFLVSSFRKIFKTTSYNLTKTFSEKNLVHIAIIGSGPAGLSAALYGARGKLHTVVFQGPQPGGQLTTTTWVENWPGIGKSLGMDIMEGLKERVQEFGAVLSTQTIVKVDFSQWPFILLTDEGIEIRALSVILAMGAKPKKLGCPGEEEYWSKGVATCAICDAPFYKDTDIVVVGGGDSAAEEAMQLAPYAKTIRILVRGSSMRASAAMQDHVKEYKNIEIIYNTFITEIKGDKKHVTAITVETNGEEQTWPIDGIFLAIGHIPNTHLLEKQKINRNEHGYIILGDRTQETAIKGVFAAGDVADYRYRQAGVASGDGIKAALDALEFLRDKGISEQYIKQTESQLYNATEHVRHELPLILIQEEFDEVVGKSPIPVVVDFYTNYCPSCLQMLPIVEQVAALLKDTVKFVKVDALASRELAVALEVPTVPTLLIFKNGKEVSRTKNILRKQELLQLVEQYQ